MKIPYSSEESLLIYQSYESWVSWWSPNAETRVSDLLGEMSTPILAVSPLQEINSKSINTTIINIDEHETVEIVIDSWINQLKIRERSDLKLNIAEMILVNEIITVKTSDSRSLIGLLWEDDQCWENQRIIIHIRGKTGTPITEPLTSQMAEVYLNNKIATLVIELHRSGYGGSLESVAEMDIEDIHTFVRFILKRGYTHIILSGQSLGSNSIMRYCVQYPHSHIRAMLHFAPTQDAAKWLINHLGSDAYNSLVEQAKKAIENGQGNLGLIGKPPYDQMLSPLRPNAWLSWWGPDADTANLKTISEVTIPILMLSCIKFSLFNSLIDFQLVFIG